jgi:hypothetical protein
MTTMRWCQRKIASIISTVPVRFFERKHPMTVDAFELSEASPDTRKAQMALKRYTIPLVVVLVTALMFYGSTPSNNTSPCQYPLGQDTTRPPSPFKFAATHNDSKVLNVHIVPHTHDDVGWPKTVEQYYFGLNNSIQHAAVHEIIDLVVAALLEHPSRTFTYVEQKFFSMWWERQTDAVKDSVRFLVANQQLNFANGGWCMHDEATTHYMGMIDQTTLGHSFLKRELGVIPKVGWQLDPFGHSASQASMFTSMVGFDALYFGRIDYQDLRMRQLERECEGLWNSSTSLNDTTVFWGLTGSFGGMYGAPRGWCFDDIACDDPKLTKMNTTMLLDSIQRFLRVLRVQSDQTKGNHIMLTMGEDFQVRVLIAGSDQQ